MKLKMRVLIAEDDENDALLVQRAIQKFDPAASFYIARNGVEARAYMKGEGEFADRQKHPFPRILITDLKMPKLNGFELLEWLHDHPECNVIPKIVLSASNIQEDVVRAYKLGANAFFQKPAGFDDLLVLVKKNFEFWLTAELPPDNIVKCG